ncbi:MAG: hypothetical protein JSW58_13970 [Candidatus Latescibacterota bacterium]|nr:MAG: hypothetical protein JSW58_13970 [Candidatus Latescibacterota bacterium]
MRRNEVKINAKGLSNPGPRMMVESVLAEQECKTLRVVVTSEEAVKDLEEYFDTLGATIEVDQIGEEIHMLVDLPVLGDELP